MVQYRPAQLTTAASVWLAVVIAAVLMIAPWIVYAVVQERQPAPRQLALGVESYSIPVDTTLTCTPEADMLGMTFDCEGTRVSSTYGAIGKDPRNTLERKLRLEGVVLGDDAEYHRDGNVARLAGSREHVVSLSVELEGEALYITIWDGAGTLVERDIMRAVENHAH